MSTDKNVQTVKDFFAATLAYKRTDQRAYSVFCQLSGPI